MRFVIIGPVYPFRGGISHYTTMLIKSLRDKGHKVLAISFKRQYPKIFFPGSNELDPSKSPLIIQNPKYLIDSLNPITWINSYFHIIRFKPEIIVFQWWTTFWSPVWLFFSYLNKFTHNRKLIYICHNVLPHENIGINRLLASYAFKYVDHFFVQSENEKNKLLELNPTASITIKPHPTYSFFTNEKISKEEALTDLQIPITSQVVLFFGITRKYKGLKDLISAMKIVKQNLDNVYLLIAGEFWEPKQSYIDEIKRVGISDTTIIHDYYIPNEELHKFFHGADLLVAPYRHITGSGVVNLAKGFGVPTITTWKEPGSESESNFPIQPGNIEELAQKIIEVLKNPNIQKKVPKKDNTWIEFVNEFETIFKK
jgi:glycosyltransferase involved in cell wall biosynthesis